MNWLKIIIISGTILLVPLFAKNIFAAVRCETQYGGGEVCVKTGQLQIDKEVWDTESQKFVDNLGITSWKFTSGDEITFKLRIKNVGDATFDKVSINDILPDFLQLSSGNLSFEITDLTPGETEEREIKARVVASDKFPADKSVVCVVNTAEVKSGDERDRDTTQVCLEKKVLGIKRIPATGPENSALVLLGSLFMGILGLAFIYKNKLPRKMN